MRGLRQYSGVSLPANCWALVLWSLLGLLVCVLPVFADMAALSDEPLTTMVKGVNDATLDMYLAIASITEKDKNILVSPLSAALCAAMVHAGAGGETADQIVKALHFPTDSTLREKGFSALHETLANTKNVTLEVANRIYVEKTSKLKENFKDVVSRVHHSEVQPADFLKNAEGERVKINGWVSEKTRDKIKDILTPGILNSDSRIVLVNAIYFYGKWKEPFDKQQTYDEEFFVSNEKTVKVPMMHLTKNMRFAEIPALDAKAVELPYTNPDVYMQIILPNEKDGLPALQQKLRNGSFDLSSIQFHSTKVQLSLPKFKLEQQIDMKNIFQKMGMNKMFSNEADFSGMVEGEPLKVSDAVQKTFMDVNEEGTEAAAATGIAKMEDAEEKASSNLEEGQEPEGEGEESDGPDDEEPEQQSQVPNSPLIVPGEKKESSEEPADNKSDAVAVNSDMILEALEMLERRHVRGTSVDQILEFLHLRYPVNRDKLLLRVELIACLGEAVQLGLIKENQNGSFRLSTHLEEASAREGEAPSASAPAPAPTGGGSQRSPSPPSTRSPGRGPSPSPSPLRAPQAPRATKRRRPAETPRRERSRSTSNDSEDPTWRPPSTPANSRPGTKAKAVRPRRSPRLQQKVARRASPRSGSSSRSRTSRPQPQTLHKTRRGTSRSRSESRRQTRPRSQPRHRPPKSPRRRQSSVKRRRR